MSAVPHFCLLACDSMVGGEVLDTRGGPLGQIAHIVIDASYGRIAYAVLARGGVFGIGDTLFAIPWSALGFEEERGAFVLRHGGDRLDAARAFDHDRWPAMDDPGWARAVHAAYRATPYWEEAAL